MRSPDDYRQRLIAARARLGLTPREMAARLMTPRTTYYQWESGERRTPGIAVVAAELIADIAATTGAALRPLPATVDTIGDRVRPLCDGTRTVQEIAETLDLTVAQARNAIQNMRMRGERPAIRPRRPGRKPTIESIVAPCLTGELTVAEIVEQTGCNEAQVWKVIARRRSRGQPATFRRRPARGRLSSAAR